MAKKKRPAGEKRNQPTLQLQATGLLFFSGNLKRRISRACVVSVFDRETGEPVEGVPIHFAVIHGPLALLPGTLTEMDERTDLTGEACVHADVQMTCTAVVLA